jgi:hypothetical protein
MIRCAPLTLYLQTESQERRLNGGFNDCAFG